MADKLYLFMWPKDGIRKPIAEEIVAALRKEGLAWTEQPDEFGHWILKGHDFAIDLTLKDGVVTGASLKMAANDESLIMRVASVLKAFGWEGYF